MKSFRAKSGPFAERPYYSDTDIENICTDELRAQGLYPSSPSPIRIDRFVEKRFAIVPAYEDLGDGVLGLTKFGPNGVQAIIVARSLDQEGTKPAERRIRTTLAHEAGHGLLHTHLFLKITKERSLFGDFTEPGKPKVLCRDVPNTSPSFRQGYDGKWWEFQANRAIGALLLPRPLVYTALDPLLETAGLLGGKILKESARDEAIRVVAELFNVNPVVAKIRLQELFFVGNEAQLRL